jgi:hypothetical protein
MLCRANIYPTVRGAAMKLICATSLAIGLAILLGSTGVSSALPRCPSDQSQYRDNCFGTDIYGPSSKWAGDKYVGEYRDGKWNGVGTYTYADGAKYVGEFRDGKANGQGTITFPNGNKYVGEWKDNRRNGQGTETFPNGDKFVGEYRDDKRNGLGTYTWPNGNKYVGEYRDGKKNGQGTETYPDGEKYVGEYRDDKRNGQGTFTFANGNIDEGIWSNNELQYAQEVSTQRKLELQQASYGQKCQEIGFTPKTENFGNCILRLMEMQSNNRPQTVIQKNTSDDSAVRALLEEQQRQRELEGSLEMMRRGFEMMSPPKPKLSCTYDPYTYKTVCN